ncbi:MAG: hypothetical protein Q4P84_08205, partial [Elusimicrobiales bacterium]|nr:hypothetical protein [Elusimicrobiales bacterium]
IPSLYWLYESDTVYCMKLELGDRQTLAHQDENGVWQLNEIPDYGEQLARCQRHQIIFGDFISNVALGIGQAVSDTQAIIHIPLPVTMNKMPTPVLTGVISIRCANVYYQSSSVSLDAAGPVEIMLRCVLSGLTPGAVCEAFIVPANQLILDANL